MFPLQSYKHKIPTSKQPGGYAAVRKYDIHTGVDLYCNENDNVYAIESGVIIRSGHFTGEQAGSPWWNNTDFILVKGKSGCILYGEIQLSPYFLRGAIGDQISEGTILGKVIPVLKKDKGLPMNMLHIELYKPRYQGEGVIWNLNTPKPEPLKDITPLLKREFNREKPFLRRLLGYIGIINI